VSFIGGRMHTDFNWETYVNEWDYLEEEDREWTRFMAVRIW
jgi:hypothetical protein